MPIVTKRGDKGESDTLNGRLRKTSRLFTAIGAVDLANATIGTAYEIAVAIAERERNYIYAISDIREIAAVLISIGFVIGNAGIYTKILGTVFMFATICLLSSQHSKHSARMWEYVEISHKLNTIMNANFNLGSCLAEATVMNNDDKKITFTWSVSMIEDEIEQLELKLDPLRNFILPCGDELSAALHLCRAQVRVMELQIVKIHKGSSYNIDESLCIWANRLSDYMFMLARYSAHYSGHGDIIVRQNA